MSRQAMGNSGVGGEIGPEEVAELVSSQVGDAREAAFLLRQAADVIDAAAAKITKARVEDDLRSDTDQKLAAQSPSESSHEWQRGEHEASNAQEEREKRKVCGNYVTNEAALVAVELVRTIGTTVEAEEKSRLMAMLEKLELRHPGLASTLAGGPGTFEETEQGVRKRGGDIAEWEDRWGLDGATYVSPLFAAIATDSLELVRWLLQHGADADLGAFSRPSWADTKHTPPLQMAIHRLSIARELLDAGASAVTYPVPDLGSQSADVQKFCHIARYRPLPHTPHCWVPAPVDDAADAADAMADTTPLHDAVWMADEAAAHELAEELLTRGARVDALACDDVRALHLASHRGHARVVRLLLAAGADACSPAAQWAFDGEIERPNENVYGTPLEVAEESGNDEAAAVLRAALGAAAPPPSIDDDERREIACARAWGPLGIPALPPHAERQRARCEQRLFERRAELLALREPALAADWDDWEASRRAVDYWADY